MDQTGTAITDLFNYDVSVNVTSSANLGSLAAAVTLRIDVNVTGPDNETFSLSGYRTNY